MLKYNEFLPGFAALCEVYERKASDALAEIYYEALKDSFDGDSWKKAVGRVLTNRVYSKLPLPAELIFAVHGSPDDNLAALDGRARRAFGILMQAAVRIGVYDSVEFEDATIGRVIKSGWGSWPKFCNDDAEPQWLERRFMDTYKAFDGKVQEVDHLAGIHEVNAVACGRADMIPQTHLISGTPDGKFIDKIYAPKQVEKGFSGLLKSLPAYTMTAEDEREANARSYMEGPKEEEEPEED